MSTVTFTTSIRAHSGIERPPSPPWKMSMGKASDRVEKEWFKEVCRHTATRQLYAIACLRFHSRFNFIHAMSLERGKFWPRMPGVALERFRGNIFARYRCIMHATPGRYYSGASISRDPKRRYKRIIKLNSIPRLSRGLFPSYRRFLLSRFICSTSSHPPL